jgi:hypothetical protein
MAGEPRAVERLPKRLYFGILALSVVVFLFAFGPFWDDPWNLAAPIGYSYLTIPALVLVGLAYTRRLSFVGFFLDTLEIVLIKFALTYTIATIAWATAGREPERQKPRPAAPASDTAPASGPALPPPSEIDPGETGRLSGVVRDEAGAPVSGALVYVAAGLERFSFRAPPSPLVLSADGGGVAPPLSALEIGQPLRARSGDGRLHTLHAAEASGATAFNIPAVEGGERVLTAAYGEVTLRCTVHPEEPAAYLVVLSHPFSALTGPDGRFSFAGVPSGALTLAARDQRRRAEVKVEVAAGAGVEAEVVLGR